MNIDTYADQADQNNTKYPNKTKLIKIAVEWMKSDDFSIHFEKKKKRAWMHFFVLESVLDSESHAILREWEHWQCTWN